MTDKLSRVEGIEGVRLPDTRQYHVNITHAHIKYKLPKHILELEERVKKTKKKDFLNTRILTVLS